jgi:hypothetical protein
MHEWERAKELFVEDRTALELEFVPRCQLPRLRYLLC